MKQKKFGNSITLFIIFFICLFVMLKCTSETQIKDLFTDVPPELITTDMKAFRFLDKIKLRKTVVELRVVKINIELLKKTKEPVILNLFKEKELQVRYDKINRRSKDDYSWSGNLIGDIPGRVTFIIMDRNVTGMIRPGNELYSIEPIGDDYHALIKLDPSKYPMDHPPEFHKKISEFEPLPKEMQLKQPWGRSLLDWIFWRLRYAVINVIVAYTPSASSAVADIESLIKLAVEETNQSYVDSNINIYMSMPRFFQTNYTESGSFFTDLTRFWDPNDGFMDEIHDLRDEYKADIAVLIINDDAYCGLADGIGVTEDHAFAVVYYDCATGYFSFAHEIGHLQGARHDPEHDSTNTPYAYGHGYNNCKDYCWRTIMSYSSACDSGGYCTRIQYWSNPGVSYNDIPLGTTASHNNAKVLNETRWTVRKFR